MKKALLAALLVAPSLSFASVSVCTGTAAQAKASGCLDVAWDLSELRKVFLNKATDVDEAYGTIDGVSSHNIRFSSAGSTFDVANGFALLTAFDSGTAKLTDLTIETNSLNPGETYGMELLEFSLNGRSSTAEVKFDWHDTDGGYGAELDALNNAVMHEVTTGETWFTIWANPEALKSLRLTATEDLEVASFKHLKVDSDQKFPVSSPGTMALLGLGLIGLGLKRRGLQ